MQQEYAFEMASAAIRFGFGVTREVGAELADLGKQHTLVFTDANLRRLPPVATVLESLERNKIRYSIFDRVRVEPTDESFCEAIGAAQADSFDSFVAVGGGSTMDTAKAANLYSCYPADFLDYVNPPIGKGKPVPGPLKPLLAIPTTAGTGSETTGVAVFDLSRMHAKTGIAHRRLKPTLGLIDPENTRMLPPEVAASSGLDVLSHAIESYTALPFTRIRVRTRSATSGAWRRCGWSEPTCDARWPTRRTTRRARRCCLRPLTRESDSATRACICRMGCRIPFPVWCGITARRATRWTTLLIRSGSR